MVIEIGTATAFFRKHRTANATKTTVLGISMGGFEAQQLWFAAFTIMRMRLGTNGWRRVGTWEGRGAQGRRWSET